ncbi:hypothetical protein EVAR_39737_1 [Eumeta japonica]|uniref:Uncharacterized protein n=1 Tax=Eumeta variegata TaxID=151549 RepID=A0A4C1X2T3_EUMVA|nr:hypothetical protein EVAR_39737_1 [Eumeta japonica]
MRRRGARAGGAGRARPYKGGRRRPATVRAAARGRSLAPLLTFYANATFDKLRTRPLRVESLTFLLHRKDTSRCGVGAARRPPPAALRIGPRPSFHVSLKKVRTEPQTLLSAPAPPPAPVLTIRSILAPINKANSEAERLSPVTMHNLWRRDSARLARIDIRIARPGAAAAARNRLEKSTTKYEKSK